MSAPEKPPSPPTSLTPEPERPAETSAAPDTPLAEDFATLARAQEGLTSAESFWKAAGRFARLR